jgi:hypothetical protein
MGSYFKISQQSEETAIDTYCSKKEQLEHQKQRPEPRLECRWSSMFNFEGSWSVVWRL